MTNVAIYARQSLDVTEGIERQLARTRTEAEHRGWTIAAEYVDNNVSASKVRGPKTQWAAMLADAERGKFTHVLSVDLDRLIRTTGDLATLMELNLRVVTVNGEIDLSTADGEFRGVMLAAVARFEVRRKSERQKRANEQRTAKGKPVPGRRRYGYESDNMTPRQPEASDVQALFASFLDGASIRSLALARGWRNLRVRETLANPSYAGYVRHKDNVIKSDFITSLIKQADFEAVQAILNDPARKTTPGSAVKHLASGIARCGVCGSPMLFMRSYRCKADAKHPSIVKPTLDNAIREAVVAALTFGPNNLTPADAEGHTLGTIRAALESIATRRQNLLELTKDGVVSLGEVRPQLAALKTEEDALVARREGIERTSIAASLLANLKHDLFAGPRVKMQEVSAVKAELRQRWDALDLDRQRELLRSLLSVTVNPGRSADRIVIEHKAVTPLNEEVA